jgi:hypothetical protein
LHKVGHFYESYAKVLTSNFAGRESIAADEDLDEGDNKLKERLSMNLSRYEYLKQKGDLGFWPTLFTFIKVNIVAGFLFLPNGFKNGGWLFSIIGLTAISMFTIYCNIAISACTEAANSFSFSRIGFKAAGKVGYYLVEIGIAISQVILYSNNRYVFLVLMQI